MTGKMPFRADAVLSWRHPNMKNGINEPLAYIISNTTMYKFNYWNFPLAHETLDTRYYLFDCVKTDLKVNNEPNSNVYIGPSYKQAFIENDVYKNNQISRDEEPIPQAMVSPFVARLLHDKRRRHNNNGLADSDETLMISQQLSSEADSFKFKMYILPFLMLFFVNFLF